MGGLGCPFGSGRGQGGRARRAAADDHGGAGVAAAVDFDDPVGAGGLRDVNLEHAGSACKLADSHFFAEVLGRDLHVRRIDGRFGFHLAFATPLGVREKHALTAWAVRSSASCETP